VEIEDKVKLAKVTEISIAKAREVYRPVATRGSLVYFLIDNLNALDRVYHYSMANFMRVLVKGMDVTPGGWGDAAAVMHCTVCTVDLFKMWGWTWQAGLGCTPDVWLGRAAAQPAHCVQHSRSLYLGDPGAQCLRHGSQY
jgi:hypothetical protein